jgi:hypothetical protein
MKKGKSTKSLNCKFCGEEVKNVGHDAVKITCWKCVNLSMQSNVPLADEGDDD